MIGHIGGTECRAEKQPLSSVQQATLYDNGTRSRCAVTSAIRKPSDNIGLLEIDPVAGCKTARPETVVYDRLQIREIGFPSQFSTYTADLADKVWRDRTRVELRGIARWMGNGDCSVKLMWAKQPS